MKPTIVVALNEAYHHKANPLYDSLQVNAPGLRKCILCIGFKVNTRRKGFEYASTSLYNLNTYRENWPENRPFYVCVEGGEFLKYFKFEPDEVIIHIDADMVLQRPFSAAEMKTICNLKKSQLASTLSADPAVTMLEEYQKLRPNKPVRSRFNGAWDRPVFCAGFLVCRADTYHQISKLYFRHFEQITTLFDHHAAGQWLMNWIVHRLFEFKQLPARYSCGIWFNNGSLKIKDDMLYCKDGLVLFNHNKFRTPKSYLKS